MHAVVYVFSSFYDSIDHYIYDFVLDKMGNILRLVKVIYNFLHTSLNILHSSTFFFIFAAYDFLSK